MAGPEPAAPEPAAPEPAAPGPVAPELAAPELGDPGLGCGTAGALLASALGLFLAACLPLALCAEELGEAWLASGSLLAVHGALLGSSLLGLQRMGGGLLATLRAPGYGLRGWAGAVLLLAAVMALDLGILWVLDPWLPEVEDGLAPVAVPLRLLAGVVLAPALEELFFRGVLCEGLSRRHGAWAGIGLSSALFALCHLRWPLFPGTFLFGLAMGAVQQRCHSILPCIVLHGLNNGIAATFAWPAAAGAGWLAYGLMASGALAVYLVTGRAYLGGSSQRSQRSQR